MSAALQRLRSELHERGGPVSAALSRAPVAATAAGPAQRAAAGPRAAAQRAEYELLVETIFEGYLVHYRASRLLADADPDLGLLAGDQLYALGLDRLVALGDVAAVAELADVISLCAAAHARDDAELADAVWWAGATAVGWGTTPDHAAAKALARRGDPRAAAALRTAASAAPSPRS